MPDSCVVPLLGLYAYTIRYMDEFAINQSVCLAGARATSSKDGLFNPSCFIHTAFDNTITIADDATGGRVGYLEAFRNWFIDGKSVKLADKCSDGKVLCNPTCPL